MWRERTTEERAAESPARTPDLRAERRLGAAATSDRLDCRDPSPSAPDAASAHAAGSKTVAVKDLATKDLATQDLALMNGPANDRPSRDLAAQDLAALSAERPAPTEARRGEASRRATPIAALAQGAEASQRDRAAAQAPFALQRRMRDRLRAAARQGAMALIDIGSSKIACLIVRIEPDRGGRAPEDGFVTPPGAPRPGKSAIGSLAVLGGGLTKSRGVRQGAIIDMAETARAIRLAVTQAEKACGERVFHAVTTLTGAYSRSASASAEIALDGARTSDADVARALSACRPGALGPSCGGAVGLNASSEARMALHALPVNWSVDAQHGLRDPRGFAGERLGVDVHLLSVAGAALHNLAHCLALADLELAGVVSTPLASGLACLVGDELENGAACVDMGGGVTSAAIFLRGQAIFADSVRMGGEHVTQDIVRGLGLDPAEAERLKTLEGSAVATGGDLRAPISPADWGRDMAVEGRPTRSDLIAVIRPRVEETLELARDRLEQAGLAYMPNRRIVLTGGAAQLPGAAETAQRVFGRPARVGRPMQRLALPLTHSGAVFSAVAGLAGHLARPMDELWDYDVLIEHTPNSTLGRFWKWLRDSW